MGNKAVVPENSSPATDRRSSRGGRKTTLNSKGKTDISTPVQKPLHKPYIDIGYQEGEETTGTGEGECVKTQVLGVRVWVCGHR